MSEDPTATEKELLDRTRRLETKLHKMCTALEIVTPESTNKVSARYEEGGWILILSGVDTPISALKRTLASAVPGRLPNNVPMYLGSSNELLGYIDFT